MRIFDLRKDENTFRANATVIVLAVMCYPHDEVARNRMINGRLSQEEFLVAVNLAALHASVAGAILLARLQLFLSEPRLAYSIARALPMVRAQLIAKIGPDVRKNQRPGWPHDIATRQWPVSGGGMREAYDYYLSVAHLWAAMLHAEQHQRSDLWPSANDRLGAFLAVANWFLKAGRWMPAPEQPHRFALSVRDACHFRLPLNSVPMTVLIPLPLEDPARRAYFA